MLADNKIWDIAEAYLESRLSADDIRELDRRRMADTAYAQRFQECLDMLSALKSSGEQKQVRDIIKQVHADVVKTDTQKAKTKLISIAQNHWRTASIAACIAMVTSITTFWIAQHNNKKIASQYSLLRRDLETYKRSQNRIINNITEGQKAALQAEASYTGTGFALTNDGYLVSNFHVTSGADSIYIQTKDGNYYKAHQVAFDEAADVVVLKVDDEKFKFSKSSDVPYTFSKSKKGLGTKVFTLGFPQDEIVYNQGYISAKNGYQGDSAQYRLEIPAGPGQSGAPVIDATSGSVIGIITGKESESNATTYAISSGAVINLLNALPAKNAIKLARTNKIASMPRERQIEQLENFTCSIKIYKK